MSLKTFPLVMIRRLGFRTMLYLLLLFMMLGFSYIIITLHTNKNLLQSEDTEDSVMMFSKVRRGHRLQKHHDTEDIICKTPLYETFDHGDTRNYKHPHCEDNILEYSYKDVSYKLNTKIITKNSVNRCEYMAIRLDSDDQISYSEPAVIKNVTIIPQIQEDFFKVQCFKTAESTEPDYTQIVAKVNQQEAILERQNLVNKDKYNVLVLSAEGLTDSKLPSLFTDVVLSGYNSLGTSKDASIIPLLTGKYTREYYVFN